jgi:hypothetical protein
VTQVEFHPAPADLGISSEPSPLASARVRRRITLEQAAARARLELDDARALEENRVWRFASTGDALAAALVYATSLGVGEREARKLAGLPVGPRLVEAWSLRRWVAALAFLAACGAVLWLALADLRSREPDTVVVTAPAPRSPAPTLPARSLIRVDVYNGTEAGGAARRLADEIEALSYRVGAVGNAERRDYDETRVYFPPGGGPIADRLAAELGLETAALPDGDDPRRLVVVVGG